MNDEGEFVVLQTNTNHEDRVFGPFPTYEEAEGFMYKMAGHDHLHEFRVVPFEEPPEMEEEEEQENTDLATIPGEGPESEED